MKLARWLSVPLGMLIACTMIAQPAQALPKKCEQMAQQLYKLICAKKPNLAKGRQTGYIWTFMNGQKAMKRKAARFGGWTSDGYFSTREGTFNVFSKVYKEWSRPYSAWMPFTMYFSGGQAIHYSYDFAGGSPYSHGCIGLRNWRFAKRLYNWTPIGTPVVVLPSKR